MALDLHGTSSPGSGFTKVGRLLRRRRESTNAGHRDIRRRHNMSSLYGSFKISGRCYISQNSRARITRHLRNGPPIYKNSHMESYVHPKYGLTSGDKPMSHRDTAGSSAREQCALPDAPEGRNCLAKGCRRTVVQRLGPNGKSLTPQTRSTNCLFPKARVEKHWDTSLSIALNKTC